LIFASNSVSGWSMSFVNGFRVWLKRTDEAYRAIRGEK
jgi:hypothetical protein